MHDAGSERLESTRVWIPVAILRSLEVSGIPLHMQEEPLNRKERLPVNRGDTNLLQILFYGSYIDYVPSQNRRFWMLRPSHFAPLC